MNTQTKAQHTPGPWRFDPKDNTISVPIRHPFWREGIVASLGDTCAESREELAANARLIAESPAMLDTLRRYMRYHEGVARCDSADTQQVCNCAVCCEARAILARIEGETR